MTEYFNNLSKHLDTLGRRHSLSNVFNDFLTMAICSYNRTNIQTRLQSVDQENEELYLNTIKKYSKDELSVFPKILGELQLQIYEQPYSDILGEYFTQNITKGQNGQYFTPEPICELMSKLTANEEGIKQKNVLDPACGSGRMLLNFAKQNPNNYFYGGDVSSTCAKMATVNFFLNGLRAEVAWMNSLSLEWYGGWQINTKGLGIVPIEKEESHIWTHPPQPNDKETKQGEQLILF